MTARTSLPRIARWTGAAYLGVVFCGIFAEFFVRQSLVVPGDALATATAIAESSRYFALGIGADVLDDRARRRRRSRSLPAALTRPSPAGDRRHGLPAATGVDPRGESLATSPRR